jgi:hypothetical protein
MKAFLRGKESALLALALFAILLCAGCAETEENLSERPWNAPKTWETGIPQAMQQGR